MRLKQNIFHHDEHPSSLRYAEAGSECEGMQGNTNIEILKPRQIRISKNIKQISGGLQGRKGVDKDNDLLIIAAAN